MLKSDCERRRIISKKLNKTEKTFRIEIEKKLSSYKMKFSSFDTIILDNKLRSVQLQIN